MNGPRRCHVRAWRGPPADSAVVLQLKVHASRRFQNSPSCAVRAAPAVGAVVTDAGDHPAAALAFGTLSGVMSSFFSSSSSARAARAVSSATSGSSMAGSWRGNGVGSSGVGGQRVFHRLEHFGFGLEFGLFPIGGRRAVHRFQHLLLAGRYVEGWAVLEGIRLKSTPTRCRCRTCHPPAASHSVLAPPRRRLGRRQDRDETDAPKREAGPGPVVRGGGGGSRARLQRLRLSRPTSAISEVALSYAVSFIRAITAPVGDEALLSARQQPLGVIRRREDAERRCEEHHATAAPRRRRASVGLHGMTVEIEPGLGRVRRESFIVDAGRSTAHIHGGKRRGDHEDVIRRTRMTSMNGAQDIDLVSPPALRRQTRLAEGAPR